MIDLARGGVECHGNLVLLDKLRQVCRLRGVDLDDVEAAFLRARVEGARERGVDVRQDNALETVVTVQLHPDYGPHTPHPEDHRVCHTLDYPFLAISEPCKWLFHCTARPASLQKAVADYRR